MCEPVNNLCLFLSFLSAFMTALAFGFYQMYKDQKKYNKDLREDLSRANGNVLH